MSLTATELLNALSEMTPDQRQQLLDLSRPKLNVVPGPRVNLRQTPTEKYAAPHFTHETAWADHLANGGAYPMLLWHTKTSQEVTAHDAKEEAAFGPNYSRVPPGSTPVDPTAQLAAIFDGLSPEDQAYVREFEAKQRRAALEKAMGGLTPDQIASVAQPVTKKGARA